MKRPTRNPTCQSRSGPASLTDLGCCAPWTHSGHTGLFKHQVHSLLRAFETTVPSARFILTLTLSGSLLFHVIKFLREALPDCPKIAPQTHPHSLPLPHCSFSIALITPEIIVSYEIIYNKVQCIIHKYNPYIVRFTVSILYRVWHK